MDAHHASLGRRTLEEIRQKRTAERLHKPSSGSESESHNSSGMRVSESASGMGERDTYALLSRVKELENRNAELLKENSKLLSQIEEKEVENNSLVKRLNDIEQNTLPSLRKAFKDVSYEKDAAIVAKEDAFSQLRTIKKRLKEAEEEQYRAEEDAAALRAELNSLQQQSMGTPFGVIPSTTHSEEKILAMEKEIMDLKSELQRESMLRQQEQHKLAEEQIRTSTLIADKQELEDKLVALSKKISGCGEDHCTRSVNLSRHCPEREVGMTSYGASSRAVVRSKELHHCVEHRVVAIVRSNELRHCVELCRCAIVRRCCSCKGAAPESSGNLF